MDMPRPLSRHETSGKARFMKMEREKLLKSTSYIRERNVTKHSEDRWEEMTPLERQPFIQRAKEDKQNHEERMVKYRQTDEYITYVYTCQKIEEQFKAKREKIAAEKAATKKTSAKAKAKVAPPSTSKKKDSDLFLEAPSAPQPPPDAQGLFAKENVTKDDCSSKDGASETSKSDKNDAGSEASKTSGAQKDPAWEKIRIREMYRALPTEERRRYEERARALKEEHKTVLKKYRKSDEYREWLYETKINEAKDRLCRSMPQPAPTAYRLFLSEDKPNKPQWKNMSKEDKAPYYQKANEKKDKWEKDMDKYHNSAEWKRFLDETKRVEQRLKPPSAISAKNDDATSSAAASAAPKSVTKSKGPVSEFSDSTNPKSAIGKGMSEKSKRARSPKTVRRSVSPRSPLADGKSGKKNERGQFTARTGR